MLYATYESAGARIVVQSKSQRIFVESDVSPAGGADRAAKWIGVVFWFRRRASGRTQRQISYERCPVRVRVEMHARWVCKRRVKISADNWRWLRCPRVDLIGPHELITGWIGEGGGGGRNERGVISRIVMVSGYIASELVFKAIKRRARSCLRPWWSAPVYQWLERETGREKPARSTGSYRTAVLPWQTLVASWPSLSNPLSASNCLYIIRIWTLCNRIQTIIYSALSIVIGRRYVR